MKRRKLREILSQNRYELGFSNLISFNIDSESKDIVKNNAND